MLTFATKELTTGCSFPIGLCRFAKGIELSCNPLNSRAPTRGPLTRGTLSSGLLPRRHTAAGCKWAGKSAARRPPGPCTPTAGPAGRSDNVAVRVYHWQSRSQARPAWLVAANSESARDLLRIQVYSAAASHCSRDVRRPGRGTRSERRSESFCNVGERTSEFIYL